MAISGVGDKACAGADGIIAQAGSHVVGVAGLVADLKGDHAASSGIANALLAALEWRGGGRVAKSSSIELPEGLRSRRLAHAMNRSWALGPSS